MTAQHRKILTFVIILGFCAFAGVAGYAYLKDVRRDVLYAGQMAEIARLSGMDAQAAFAEKLDTLRTFLNDNSQHLIDDEFYSKWEDAPAMAADVIAHATGARAELPHMECATRSRLMADVLKHKGYRVRSVDLYHDGGDTTLSGHAVIDAFNPEAKRWETQDVDYDVYWKNLSTGERATMAEAAADLAAIHPCNRAHQCGWTLVNKAGGDTAALKELTAYVTLIDKDAGERVTFYRADKGPDAIVRYDGREGVYCDVIEKNCRNGFAVSNPENLRRVAD